MPILRYKFGQERGIVKENAGFDDSIFRDQYVQALRLTNAFVRDKESETLKCVAFCGDRGEGKTSCMTTTQGIIEQVKEKSDAYSYVDKIGCKDLANTKCSVVEVTDPSFFDDSHNILQITIGKLYNSYRRKQEECKVDYGKKNKLLETFSRVNASLLTLQKDDIDSMNDLHRLAVLATGITLRDQIAELVKEYLNFMGADILIVPIDDIDLNIAYAYRMCEQIRKYLCVPQCVVFLSLKIEQLQYVVENAFAATIKNPNIGKASDSNGFNFDEIAEMAKKYINKLVPVNSRVEMPKAYSLAEVKLELPTSNGGIMTMESMKKGVLELIYNRTRYLFYNPADSISPIVPNNLRDLFNLIALLAAMEEIPDSRELTKKHALETNKNMFKLYLFTVWKKRFDIDTQNKLDSLVTFDYGTSFNKEVIAILSKRFEEQLKKDYHEQTEDDYQIEDTEANISASKSESSKVDTTPQTIMLKSICATDNFGYNVTAGDLFYLFSILEREVLSENDNALLFFLKSLYSIKLYEAYDQVTELEGMVYPKTNDEEKGLTIIDRRFDHSNKLQLLTGGSYFTYCPGDFIPKPSKEVAYDIRIISGKELNGFLSELRGGFKEIEDLEKKENKTDEENKKVKEFNAQLNTAEFFILTTKCAVPQKKAETKDSISLVRTLDFLRHNVEACHYRTFYPATGYYLFDIMSIFGNMINLELTYKKFYYVNDDFYRFIFNHPGSLLHKITEKSSVSRQYINYKDNNERTQMHRLLSDSIIRNAEVLTSVRDIIVSQRKTTHEGAQQEFVTFYNKIQNSGMKTQKTSSDGEQDEITFHFLEPISELLSNILGKKERGNPDEEADIWSKCKSIFDSIFNIELKSPDNLSLTEILKTIRRAQIPMTIREKLKTIPYFSKMDDDQLKSWVPDKPDGTNYTKEEAEEIIIQKYNKEFTQEDVMVSNRPEQVEILQQTEMQQVGMNKNEPNGEPTK